MPRSRRNPYKELEGRLGYRFRKRVLLEEALTHPSYRFENDAAMADNQRLEFLGDAVLALATASRLYEKHTATDEGFLTACRSLVTRGRTLAQIARELGLGDYLRVGCGEENSGGRQRASNLEDALEAVLGAAFLDGGLKAALKVFDRLFVPLLESLKGDLWAGNPKGELQEYSQKRWQVSPTYSLVRQEGPPHDVRFTIGVRLPDGRYDTGTGRSKQEAERRAATALLAVMRETDATAKPADGGEASANGG